MRPPITRRAFLAVALLATASGPANGQVRLKAAGALAGFNSAKISTNDADGPTSRRSGWVLGGFVEMGGEGPISLQPALLISEKGGKQSANGANITAKLRYLQIPVLLRAEVASHGMARPWFILGPSFAYRIGCNVSVKAEGASLSADCDNLASIDESAEDPVKKTDFTGIIGGGVDVGSWTVGVRYDHGLTNIASATSDGESKAHTRTITVLAGFRRSLRK